MQTFAQAWLVLQLSGSSFLLGFDSFLGSIPIVLFSLVGGVFADRTERQKILLGSQYIQMACAFLLAILFATGVIHIWHILVLSFITGTAQSFGGPAYQALIPSLVKAEDLPNAIALNSIQFNVARVLGPTLGGVALLLGASWCFSLNGISFVAVIISLMIIHPHFVPTKSRETVLFSMKEGFRFIRKQGTMEALIVLAFLMTLLAFPLVVFLPVFARDVFHGGPNLYTIFLVCSGNRIHLRRADRGGHGQVQASGARGAALPAGFRPADRQLRAVALADPKLRSHFFFGRSADQRFRHYQLLGSDDYLGQHARPGDERL